MAHDGMRLPFSRIGNEPAKPGDALDLRRKKPSGTSSRTGQRISPPALLDISPLTHALTNTGQDSHMMRIDIGSRKNTVPKMSIQICAGRERREEITSMRMCSSLRSV